MVGTTRVTKSAVVWVLSEIHHLLCTCLIGNEPQNTLIFLFLRFDALHASTACKLSNSVSPFVCSEKFEKILEIFMEIVTQDLKNSS